MTVLEKEIEVYESMQNELELNHFGNWVVLQNKELRGLYDSIEDVGSRPIKNYGKGVHQIRRVGIPRMLCCSVRFSNTS